MSGTSLDAIDAALLDLAHGQIRLLDTLNHPLPDALRQQVLRLNQPGQPDELHSMAITDRELAGVFAQAVKELLQHSGIKPDEITAIGSHGQTVRHQPGIDTPYTMQIGDPNRLAELSGITTIADFRRRDIAAGGQGAPLAPAFHAAMFHSDQQNRAILNIGGMANLTLLAADRNIPVSGFDTGPGNVLLDAWYQRHHPAAYDQHGQWAGSGQVADSLLARLLCHPFFKLEPPRSTGREQFNIDYLDSELEDHQQDLAAADVQATLAELTTRSIAQALTTWADDCERLLLCGGGAYNTDLVARLRRHLPDIQVDTTASCGMAPEWIEAAAFAWLAKQTLHHQTGNLPAVTGADHAVILGGIYPA